MNAPLNRPAGPIHLRSLGEALLQHGEAFRFSKGETLWSQDTAATHLVVVRTGGIKLVRAWDGGRAPVMSLVFRGGVAGEMAALPGALYADTAVALTSGKGVRISMEELAVLVAEQPALAGMLLRTSLERQHEFAHRLEELGHGSVEGRLARVLLRIGDRVGLRDARGTFVPIKLSRNDLAEMVGCRVETAIRVMTRWQREGLVETRREGLILCDPASLEMAVA